jgi:hypothetical protein
MMDFRKLIVSLVIAVLFAVFVTTCINAYMPQPQYDKYCSATLYKDPYMDNMTKEERVAYNEEQQKCQTALNEAQAQYEFITFLVSAAAGLVGILIGLFVPVSTPVGMAIASGLLLGGLFSIFTGTMWGWQGLHAQVKPFVILAEMIIVIWVSYRKLNNPLSNSTSVKKKK